MATALTIDLSELLNMFVRYRGRLSGQDPAQQELYDSLIELNSAVVEKVKHLQDLYWNILKEQTLTPRQKANAVKKRASEWEPDHLDPVPLSDLYEEFTFELERPKEGGELPPWGVTIYGGVDSDPESGPGIYIHVIIDNSIAQRHGGLQVSDRIIEVNGSTTREVRHEVAEELLRARNQTLDLKIMRRIEPSPTDPPDLDILDVYLQTDVPARGFGIAIKGGKDDPLVEDHDGIFISQISGVAAENGNLDKGDRIISANGTNLEHVDRTEATNTITSSPHLLHLRVHKRALLQITLPIPITSCIRQVVLTTSNGNYGISLGGDEGKIFVVRLDPGGAAERSGQVFVGDQIISAGDHSTLNSTTDQVNKYLSKYCQQITLKLTHAQKQFQSLIEEGRITSIPLSPTKERICNQSYFRVNFDYNPKLDRERSDVGLEVRNGTIVRIDEYQEEEIEIRWWSALLVEGENERVQGSIPTLLAMRQGKYPGVTIPKSKQQSRRSTGFFRRSNKTKKIWQKHDFYAQIWKSEIEETRIVLIVGLLNNLLIDMLIREYPDTYQTLPLPPGNLELNIQSPFAHACIKIIESKRHVVLSIGPELLESFVKLDPIIILTCPHGVCSRGDYSPTGLSTSDGLLECFQLEQAQNTVNQIRNEFGPFISGIASGSNLGEIYYQVCTLINNNSYRRIDWSEIKPERQTTGFGPLSKSSDLLDSLAKYST